MAAETVTIDGITFVLRDGIAYRIADAAEPVAESAPAEPVAASPFALAGVTLSKAGRPVTDNRPEHIRAAAAAAPEGKRDQWAREAARLQPVAGYACDQTVEEGGVTMAAHGYAWTSKNAPSGSKCKNPSCPGKIL